MKRITAIAAALAMLVASCSATDDSANTSGQPSATSTTNTTTAAANAGPAMTPTEIEFSDQESDGTSIIVDSVVLPASGFMVIHGDGGGSPGAVLGHSDLLRAGESTGVNVTLDEPLTATATVYPMAHIDVNENEVYEFLPPDETIDGPAMFADGAVAVVAGVITVTTAAAGPGLVVAESEFGPILADENGFTLYMFVPDNQGESDCYGDCEANWPVFHGPATLGEGLDATLGGSTDRTDDTQQVTYGGWPLYYFANDSDPGDTNGQGRGTVWYVVNPDGEALLDAGTPINQLTSIDSDFGPVLADAGGNALYVFLPDNQGESTCYDDCETNWPVFHTPTFTNTDVDASIVDAVERTDASAQVTYDGWPLYYFAGDTAPGDTNGQGRGDVWYLIGLDGVVANQ